MGTQDPTQQSDDDLTGLWRQVGDQLVRGQLRLEARFDRLETNVEARFGRLETDVEARFGRLETNVAVFKTDVAARFDRLETDVGVLKTDLTATREQLGRLERSTDSRFNRVDAKLEKLITLIQRAETKRT